MNITLPFEVEVSGTGSSSFTDRNISDRLLKLKGMKQQTEEAKREVEFLEELRAKREE